MIVWIWDASGPAADACGVAGSAEAARRAAGSLLTSGRAEAARVEQAAIVIGTTLSYDYCPTGQAQAGWSRARVGARFPSARAGRIVTGVSAHKYAQAAAIIRAQVADGTLRPGQPAPSGAQLARLTGFCQLTCRRALRTLISDGVLTPGPSPSARPRVAAVSGERPGEAARQLSRALAALRQASGLTQPALSTLTGYSITTIGHAETGRLWQSREFWEKADLALCADGELTRLHDAFRAGTVGPTDAPGEPGPKAVGSGAPPPVLTCLALHWSDGTVTTVEPPGIPGPSHRLEGSTPQ